ncbi:hypothetical protein GCM10022239_24350 [Leifsonia bigeumensis]|uniref:Uncharacterized protein n=1 Tax=Leifsonella bigeumensis TaxID=433643 RepID=A0ABP7FTK3_9MICO
METPGGSSVFTGGEAHPVTPRQAKAAQVTAIEVARVAWRRFGIPTV